MTATAEVSQARAGIADRRIRAWAPYIEAKWGFRNHWYPIRLSTEAREGVPLAVQLLGEKILLNRIDGQVYAIKDRCLHRGVTLSDRVECYSKQTITCWYHGWTYNWDDGKLVDILTNPASLQIGRHALKTYPVREAKGFIFVFVGDEAPHDLIEDVPPGFLDEDLEVDGQHRVVAANWRMGVENGFDAGHVFIHKSSILLDGNDIALPLGFAPGDAEQLTRSSLEPGAPKGVYDLLGEHSVLVMEGRIGGETVIHGHPGSKMVARNISVWLPGALRVDPFPDPSLVQFEWYVPIDDRRHLYIQMLGRKVTTEAEKAAFHEEFHAKWVDMALNGFNDDDILARESMDPFYANGRGWREEVLFEPDKAIIEWRRLASQHNRGIQTEAHL
jgi:carbazole 1,9a-dioxygenase